MQTFNAVYVHGKFFEVKTGKRIYLEENTPLNIFVSGRGVLESDPYNRPGRVATDDHLIKQIQKKGFVNYKKIAAANDILAFTIKAGKQEDEYRMPFEAHFELRLRESLFMVQKSELDNKGVVFPCHCIVEAETSGLLKYFVPINAYSLNDAYMKTYDYYFTLYGKPTINVYNNFFIRVKDKSFLLKDIRMWNNR